MEAERAAAAVRKEEEVAKERSRCVAAAGDDESFIEEEDEQVATDCGAAPAEAAETALTDGERDAAFALELFGVSSALYSQTTRALGLESGWRQDAGHRLARTCVSRVCWKSHARLSLSLSLSCVPSLEIRAFQILDS